MPGRRRHAEAPLEARQPLAPSAISGSSTSDPPAGAQRRGDRLEVDLGLAGARARRRAGVTAKPAPISARKRCRRRRCAGDSRPGGAASGQGTAAGGGSGRSHSAPARARPRTTPVLTPASRASSAPARGGPCAEPPPARARRGGVSVGSGRQRIGERQRRSPAPAARAPPARSSPSAAPRRPDARCSRPPNRRNSRMAAGNGPATKTAVQRFQLAIGATNHGPGPQITPATRRDAKRHLDQIARGDHQPVRHSIIVIDSASGSGKRTATRSPSRKHRCPSSPHASPWSIDDRLADLQARCEKQRSKRHE